VRACVVIRNGNGIDMIAECLDSLSKQTQEHAVIAVERAS
jgi:hypothetical protein